MAVVPGPDGWPDAYAYTLDGRTTRIEGEAMRKPIAIRL